MPFVKRKSDPVRISQVELHKDNNIRDELECISNHTLCGIIQQLSNLNHHASDMFDDLFIETLNVVKRSNKLKDKLNEMREKYKKWNKKKIGGSLNDNENENALSQHFDQQIFSVQGRPNAIVSMYKAANLPPAISKTDQFREDGKSGLKLYTNPDFFFAHWSSQMEKKETDYSHRKTKRAERKNRRQDKGEGPRQVRRIQDKMRDKAKGAEFSTQFVQQSHGKRKKEKKKKMEGISSKQWEKQHPNQKLENVEEKDEMEESGKIHNRDENKKIVPDSSIQAGLPKENDAPPPVPMRKNSVISNHTNSALPPPPDDRYSNLPPPPPDDRYSNLPPPPPDPPNAMTNGPIQSVALPPAPHEFYQSTIDERESFYPLPPPPNESDSNEGRDSIIEPPPTLEINPQLLRTSQKLRANRISTFVFPPAMENGDNINSRKHIPPPPVFPNTSVPNAPPPPPPPPPPGLAPALNTSTTAPASVSVETTSATGMFSENSLLAMKKNLKQSKDRKTPTQSVKSNSNHMDVTTIMNRALENRRKFTEDSSSDGDDSEFSDSDCEWDE
ncbi:actin-binding protein WASF2-like isoform X2 [Mytilus trossulus]